MPWYFRIEDEHGVSPNLRKYAPDSSAGFEVNANNADKLIAEEIRDQVNGSGNRSIFSFSKSLGACLFKYNYYGDNPLYIIPCELGSYIDFAVGKYHPDFIRRMPYNINNLNYPLKKHFKNKEIFIKNYVIEVDNNNLLNLYFKNYTDVGKYLRAVPEKDCEVVIRHVESYFTIQDYISEIYLIYALQYKFNFLNRPNVFSCLYDLFCNHTENINEHHAFYMLTWYLKHNWQYEQIISKKILDETKANPRIIAYYDTYFLACDIMNADSREDIEMAYENSFHYHLSRAISDIWNVFFTSN